MSMENGMTGSDTMALDVETIADEDELASSASTGPSLTDQMKDTAQQAMTQTKEATGQALDKAKDTVKSQLSNQKGRAADTLGGFTQALHETGQQLRQHGQGAFGNYADSLADQMDRAAGFLREHDIDDLTRQAEDFARRQPVLFFGGAFVLGVALARFLKSSSEAPQRQTFATAQNRAMTPWERNAMSSDTGTKQQQNTTDRGDGSHIPEQVYGNADPSRHLDQFSDDAIPDTPVPSAHGYVAGVGSKGDDSAEGDATNSVSASTNPAAPGSGMPDTGS